jgi:hypothetical protein
MIRKNVNARNLLLSQVPVMVAAILLLCLGQSPADSTVSAANAPNTRAGVMVSKEVAFEKIRARFPVDNFQTSLEMKENVDFLLTPALLVQEVISDHVVTTYPSE